MADNVTITANANSTPPDGTLVSTDDAGVDGQVQRVKLAISADGSATHIPADAANGLDVDVTRLPALVAGTANIGDVDVLTVPAPLSTMGGGTEAAALRVTVATDSTGVLSVDDNGGSLTVDGSVGISGAVDTELTTDDLDTGAGTDTRAVVGLVGSKSGGGQLIPGDATAGLKVDLGADNDVTVTGTVTANLAAGTNNIGDVDVLTVPAPLSTTGGGTEAAALRVTVANDSTGLLSVDDNGGALTVDQATAANLNAQVQGAAAHAAPSSGNPVWVAGRASTAVPTDVGADGDVAALWTNRQGASVVTMAPHVGLFGSQPWNLTSETAQYTTTQTSTVLVAGGASERIVVTSIQIQAGGTTAGTLQVYFGTGAYSRGTNLAIFDGEFAPSTTLKPGVVMQGPFISATNGDDILVTDSAAINPLTITVWYYVVT